MLESYDMQAHLQSDLRIGSAKEESVHLLSLVVTNGIQTFGCDLFLLSRWHDPACLHWKAKGGVLPSHRASGALRVHLCWTYPLTRHAYRMLQLPHIQKSTHVPVLNNPKGVSFEVAQ